MLSLGAAWENWRRTEEVPMRRWYVPLTVLGLGGIGAFLLSERGRTALRAVFERFQQAPDRLLELNDSLQSDLDRIFAYIFVRGGEKAADRFLELAQEATEFLVQNPLAGPHPRWATRHRTLRFWVISKTNFLIFYLPDEHGVSIERVLDGRRDVARIMELGIEDPSDLEE